MSKTTNVKVLFSVTYETVVTVSNDQTLDDALTDIEIPEGDSAKYVEDSFELNAVSPTPEKP